MLRRALLLRATVRSYQRRIDRPGACPTGIGAALATRLMGTAFSNDEPAPQSPRRVRRKFSDFLWEMGRLGQRLLQLVQQLPDCGGVLCSGSQFEVPLEGLFRCLGILQS